MAFFPFFKKVSNFFSDEEKEQIVLAIREAERTTSGEVRVYVESSNPLVDVVQRAKEVFYSLEMDNTQQRNGVLFYLATKDHELAIFGDENIHAKVGSTYWNKTVEELLATFRKDNLCKALQEAILHVGETLHKEFPYNKQLDKNELPDDIVFGR